MVYRPVMNFAMSFRLGVLGVVKQAAEFSSWVGFDLDGTLAKSEGEFDPDIVGEPIPKMIAKLREHLDAGDTCKILTARASGDKARATKVIQAWLKENDLPELEVTCEKDPGMRLLYDDRAVSVKKNEGTTKQASVKELMSRPCCGSGCENCPYDPPHQKGNTTLRKDLRKEACVSTINPTMEKSAVLKQEGEMWVLYTRDGKKVLGRHSSKMQALMQEYAIQKSQERRGAALPPESEKKASEDHPYGVICAVCEGRIENRNRGRQPHYRCENDHVCDDAKDPTTKEVIRYTGSMRLNGEDPITMEAAMEKAGAFEGASEQQLRVLGEAFGLGPYAKPYEPSYRDCPACGEKKARVRETHADTGMDEMELKCDACGKWSDLPTEKSAKIINHLIPDMHVQPDPALRTYAARIMAQMAPEHRPQPVTARSPVRDVRDGRLLGHATFREFCDGTIHKSAGSEMQKLLDDSDIPSDVYFYTDGKDRATVCLGDWHDKDVSDIAIQFGRANWEQWEDPDDTEIGRPEWATQTLSPRRKRTKSAAIPPKELRYWDEVREAVDKRIRALPPEEQAKAANGKVTAMGSCGHQVQQGDNGVVVEIGKKCPTCLKTGDLNKSASTWAVCAGMVKGAAEMVRKTRLVEQHDDHCPHCDHKFTEKGYPRRKYNGESDEEWKAGFDSGDYDEHCPNCDGIVDRRELSDEEIKSCSWGNTAIEEQLRKQRDTYRKRKASRETTKSAAIASAIRRARNATHTDPTPAQAEAGNYAKGEVKLHGMTIKIENPKGTTRRGYNPDGTVKWESAMKADYGYFKGTKAVDGDAIDCFIGPDPESEMVVAIDQYRGDTFDETKFVLGVKSQDEGTKLYLTHYPKGWKLGPVSTCSVQQLKEWLKDGRHTEPFKGQMIKVGMLQEAERKVGDFMRGDDQGADWRWGILGYPLTWAAPASAAHLYAKFALPKLAGSAKNLVDRRIYRQLKHDVNVRDKIPVYGHRRGALADPQPTLSNILRRIFGLSQKAKPVATAFKPIPGEIDMSFGLKHPGILAHEIGHARGGKLLMGSNIVGKGVLPMAAQMGLLSRDEDSAKTWTGVGTVAGAGVLASELDASRRGYQAVRALGGGRASALRAFAGIPTYLALAAFPTIAYSTKKRLGGFDHD